MTINEIKSHKFSLYRLVIDFRRHRLIHWNGIISVIHLLRLHKPFYLFTFFVKQQQRPLTRVNHTRTNIEEETSLPSVVVIRNIKKTSMYPAHLQLKLYETPFRKRSKRVGLNRAGSKERGRLFQILNFQVISSSFSKLFYYTIPLDIQDQITLEIVQNLTYIGSHEIKILIFFPLSFSTVL